MRGALEVPETSAYLGAAEWVQRRVARRMTSSTQHKPSSMNGGGLDRWNLARNRPLTTRVLNKR